MTKESAEPAKSGGYLRVSSMNQKGLRQIEGIHPDERFGDYRASTACMPPLTGQNLGGALGHQLLGP